MGAKTYQIKYPQPQPLSLLDVTWSILSTDHKDRSDALLLESGALMCMDPRYYESLSKNMAEIMRYLKQQKAVITQYELDIEESNDEVSNESTLSPGSDADSVGP